MLLKQGLLFCCIKAWALVLCTVFSAGGVFSTSVTWGGEGMKHGVVIVRGVFFGVLCGVLFGVVCGVVFAVLCVVLFAVVFVLLSVKKN